MSTAAVTTAAAASGSGAAGVSPDSDSELETYLNSNSTSPNMNPMSTPDPITESKSNPEPTTSEPGAESKSIIITGGSSGIGLALVHHFVSLNINKGHKHRIAILDIDPSGRKVASSCNEQLKHLLGPQPPALVDQDSAPNENPDPDPWRKGLGKGHELSRDESGSGSGSGSGYVTFIKCDVSKWEEQASAFKTIYELHGGRIDLVFANAGISEQGRTTVVDLDLDDDDDDGVEDKKPIPPKLKVLDVNLLGCIYSVNLATHYMKKKKPLGGERGGSIICTASNAGLYPFPVAPLYGVSKAGVINLVRSLAKPLAGLDIRINALAPATVETNIAPDKSLFTKMVITPMETVLRAVDEILADEDMTGQVAEIHGDKVTLRPHHEFVDEDSRRNLEVFEQLGYA